MSDRTGIEYRTCHIEGLLPTTKENLMACPAFLNRIVGYEELEMSNGGIDIKAELVCNSTQEMLQTCENLRGTSIDQVAIEHLKVVPDPRNLDWQNALKIIDELKTDILQKIQEVEAAQHNYVQVLYENFPA